jgi:hypothetical protein
MCGRLRFVLPHIVGSWVLSSMYLRPVVCRLPGMRTFAGKSTLSRRGAETSVLMLWK